MQQNKFTSENPSVQKHISCDGKLKPTRAKLPNRSRKPLYREVNKMLTTLYFYFDPSNFPQLWEQDGHMGSFLWNTTAARRRLQQTLNHQVGESLSFFWFVCLNFFFFFTSILAAIINGELVRPRKEETPQLV